MDSFGEKFNNFSSLVLQDAGEKKEKQMAQLHKKYKFLMESKENEYLQEAYEQIQKCVNDSRKEASERLLHIEMDSRKKLLLKREAIIEEVTAAVIDKLREFKKTPEYVEWLKSKLKIAFFELGKGAKIVYIAGDDMDYRGELEKVQDTSRVTIEGSLERDFLGGIKVLNTDRKVSVDYSFKDMISEEKKLFLQKSGLAID